MLLSIFLVGFCDIVHLLSLLSLQFFPFWQLFAFSTYLYDHFLPYVPLQSIQHAKSCPLMSQALFVCRLWNSLPLNVCQAWAEVFLEAIQIFFPYFFPFFLPQSDMYFVARNKHIIIFRSWFRYKHAFLIMILALFQRCTRLCWLIST